MTFTPSTFPYFNNLPNSPNYPGNDQPGMQTNTASTQSIFDVDHVDFATSGAGWHEKVTFVNTFTPTGPPAGNISGIYPIAGVLSTKPQAIFQNADATFPLSLIRAYVTFTTANFGPIVPTNQYNVVGNITVTSSVIFTMNLTANAASDNAGVIISTTNSTVFSAATISSNVLTVTIANPTIMKVTVLVVQF